MVKVMLATHLSELVEDGDAGTRVRSVMVGPGSWGEFVGEMRERYPRLAERVFAAGGGVAPGYALVLNDEVMHGDPAGLRLAEGDELCLLVTIAGG